MTPEEIARRSAEAMWADDRASRALGMSVDAVGPGTATLSLTLGEDMVNGHGIGHGGITFTLADGAGGGASNSHTRAPGAAAASIGSGRPPPRGDLGGPTAAELTREGPDGVYDVLVTVGDVVVAVFVGRSKEIGGTLFPADGEPQS